MIQPLTVVEEHAPGAELTPYVENVHALMSGLAADIRLPDLDLTIVLTGDITASIRERGEDSFQPERIGGGLVAGKAMALARDYSRTAIVISAGASGTDDDFDPVRFLHVLVHEYGHTFIGRLRSAAGTRPPLPTHHQTPAEAAACIAYGAADEYRCDLLSNLVLNKITLPAEGARAARPFTLEDMFEDGFRSILLENLDSVHPGWPNLVHSYRTWQITLEDMFGGLVKATEAILILIAHADAVEQAAGRVRLLDDCGDHPAVTQYLAPAWRGIRDILDTAPVIPDLSQFAAVDLALQECGQQIVDLWATLGVRGHLTAEDQLYISVD